jgi:tripartite-type tricarboxylate transporter receptor subunit TctC
MQRLRGLTLLACLFAGTAALAADYPSRSVRLVVPFPPGGITDVLARHVADRLSARFGKPVVVDNRPGAGGTIGAGMVARAAPDGYTLLFGATSTIAVSPSMYRKNLPYDPIRDFAAITRVASVPSVLVVHPSAGIASVQALREAARRAPGKWLFGSAGPGTSQHLAGTLFEVLTDTRMTHVPYQGGAPALSDLVGGHVDLMFEPLPTALPFIRSGTLRAVAVTTPARTRALPHVPTLAESGVPGYDLTWWFGITAPAGLPAERLAKLNTTLRDVLQEPALRTAFTDMGASPLADTPEAFARLIRADINRWAALVERAGVTAD